MIYDASNVPSTIEITNNGDRAISLRLLPNGNIYLEKGETTKYLASDSEELLIIMKSIEDLEDVEISTSAPSPEPEPGEETVVSDLDGLQEAISEGKSNIKIDSNITVPTGDLNLSGATNFNGNGKTITFEEAGKSVVFSQSAVVENVIVENSADSNSTPTMKVSNGTYTVKNCTLKGGDSGLSVEGATVNLEGTVDVSGNTSAGIKVSGTVSRSTGATLNVNGATLVNSSEEYGKPTILAEQGTSVTGADSMTDVQVGTQTNYYLNEENSKKTDTIDDINLTEKTQAFCTQYYNKYANKNITSTDEEFINDIVYVNLGSVDVSSVDSITINEKEHDSSNKSISIGNNGFIKSPLWKIEDGSLYVSIFILAINTTADQIEVVCGNNIKVITDTNSIPATVLPITEVLALNTQEGYTNDVTASDNNTKIVENSEHGTHAVGIVLQSEGEDILDTGIYYLYYSESSMGISTPELMDGENVTFAFYGKYSTKPYTEAEQRVFNFTLLIPTKGAAEFQLTVNCEVKSSEE